MKQKIVSYLKEIEKENEIKILFAIESGSRLWSMESRDSDYDVRFVFVQLIEEYLSLSNREATKRVINETYEQGMIDISGFDIFKYCKLLAKSNPSMIEWMQSDIVYYGRKPEGLKRIALTQFSPKALVYHYQSMCKQNYEKYLASKQTVTYKKYLYAMRGLVNAKYVERTGKLPPISFPEGIEQSKGIIPKEIIAELNDTIEKKKRGREKEIIRNIVRYDRFIESFLEEDKKEVKEVHLCEKEINEELRRIILRKE